MLIWLTIFTIFLIAPPVGMAMALFMVLWVLVFS